ncbi:MAG TPA: hypothetical protein VFV95_05095 [Vicinamibacterales bacterium]|nr:hypothetical protein [Vicinamibacterales bacterium]
MAVVAALSTLAVAAQDNQFQVFLAVTEAASGKPVVDLKPEDISMSESGMPGKVVTLERYNLPVKLTLAIDNGPDTDRAVEFYRTGLTGLVDALPPDLEINVWTTAPQPRQVVRPTTDRGEIKKAFGRLGRESESPRFTDALMEFGDRLDKDVKAKKVNYLPFLIMIATPADDATTYQLQDVQKSIGTMAKNGAVGSVIMTTSKVGSSEYVRDLTEGRQGTIARLLVQSTRGQFQAIPDPRNIPGTLAEWGKALGDLHTKQTNQYRLVLQRPAGVSGQINPQNLDLRVTRAGLAAAVSGNGRY